KYIICFQVYSDKANKKKREQSNVNREFDRRVTGESNDCGRSIFPDSCNAHCQVDDSSYSEPPKKQYKFEEDSARFDGLLSKSSIPGQLDVVIEERNTANNRSVVKSEVVTVECDPNVILTFPGNDDNALDLLSLAVSDKNKGPIIKSKTNSGKDESDLCLQKHAGKNDSKVSTLTFWERERSGTKLPVLSGNSGTEVNLPTFSENGVRISENNRCEINPVAYSRDNVSAVNPPSCSGMNGPHPEPHVCGESNRSGINPSIYSGAGINPSVYLGNSELGIHSSAYSGNSSINSASYPVYNRPGYTSPLCPGNNVLGINYLPFSGSDKSELNPSYSGNDGMGINSLTFSGNRRTMMPLTYYGNDASVITPQTYSGNGPKENSLAYSGSNSSGISVHTYPGNNESGTNTLTYSTNNGPSLSYCGNKGSVVNSQPYPTNSRDMLNSQSYTVNSGPGISSSSYSGNTGLGMKSPAYHENSSPSYSGNSESGLNSAAYSGNNGSGVNHMRFVGGSSFSGSEVAQQYEVLQSYCGNSESRIDNTSCQESTWSNDYITLNSLPTSGYEAADCVQDFSYLFPCQVCGNMSTVVDELIRHWRLHTGVDSLTCTVCYVSFTDVLFLQAHWKATHMGGVCSDSGVVLRNQPEFLPQLVCEACGFSFVQFSALEQHVMSTHIPITQHRESVSWRSSNNLGSLYGGTNSQQNNVVNSKNPQGIPIINNHSLAKQFTVLKSNIIGTDGQDHSVIELENNVLESNITEHSMIRHSAAVANNVTESDDDPEDVDTEGDHHSSVDSRKVESLSGQNGKLFKCKVCGSNSYDVNALIKHWRIHIGANSMTCTICKKTFSDLPFLQAHWKRSHLQGNPVPTSVSKNHLAHNESLVCEACGYAFPDLTALEQHLLSTHVTASSSHVPLKNVNYADNTQTMPHAHKQNVTLGKTKSLDLITHRIQVMNNYKKRDVEKQPETEGCKESEDPAEMKENAKKLNNKYSDLGSKRNKDRDWCLVCGETSDDMIKHLITHTGVLSLECCLCGKDFVDIPFLQAHWRATHMDGEVCQINNCVYVGNYKANVSHKEKLLCETCGCYVPQISALEKHIILTHTVVRPPYECKCDDVFPSEAELKRHILTCSW
ncbi:hypothetical protein B7P43_G06977, partial [Cryptotermes secundus]